MSETTQVDGTPSGIGDEQGRLPTSGSRDLRAPEGGSKDTPPIAAPTGPDVDPAQPDGPAEDEIELVIGITRAMGTPTDVVVEQLSNSLGNFGYETKVIKISKLIEDDLVFETDEAIDPRPH